MINREQAEEVERLMAERRAFVLATVVRARRPTSVRPGDAALVLPDGTIQGFVGGVCAESSVRLYALRVLETGEPLLLHLVPGDGEGGDPSEVSDGAVVERNPCLSGGSLEIFLEPHLPAPRVIVVGDTPIAKALAQLAQAAGYDSRRTPAAQVSEVAGAAAVIVASHGSGEEAVLAEALTAGVAYVALVASPKRGQAVRSELGLPSELGALLHTPAGLDIGARTPNEIAISILAELVSEQHADPVPGRSEAKFGSAGRSGAPESASGVAPMTAPAIGSVAIDPVCGMKVAIAETSLRLEVGGQPVFFCGEGCRQRYADQHADEAPVRR